MTYKITNQQLFDSKLDDVNTDTLRVGIDHLGRIYFVGALDIIFNEGGSQCYDGEHGPNDFEEEYGFILVIPDNQ